MRETLLQFLLRRLDSVPEPRVSHQDLASFAESDIKSLLAQGILRAADDADHVHRQTKQGQVLELAVRRTGCGIIGVVEDDDYFEPVPLAEEEIRQYEIVVGKIADRIRRENEIDGRGSPPDGGLLLIGERALGRSGLIQVYLAFPNDDYDAFRSRCGRLQRQANTMAVVVLTPQLVTVSPEDRRLWDAGGVVLVSLWTSAKSGHLAVDWERLRQATPPASAKSKQKQAEQPVSIREFIERYCCAMASGRAEQLAKRVIQEARRAKVRLKLPPTTNKAKGNQKKYFRPADLRKRWATYQLVIPTLPDIK